MVKAVNTDSQVCSLQWGKHEKELLSSHGFSDNQLTLWNYPKMVGGVWGWGDVVVCLITSYDNIHITATLFEKKYNPLP